MAIIRQSATPPSDASAAASTSGVPLSNAAAAAAAASTSGNADRSLLGQATAERSPPAPPPGPATADSCSGPAAAAGNSAPVGATGNRPSTVLPTRPPAPSTHLNSAIPASGSGGSQQENAKRKLSFTPTASNQSPKRAKLGSMIKPLVLEYSTLSGSAEEVENAKTELKGSIASTAEKELCEYYDSLNKTYRAAMASKEAEWTKMQPEYRAALRLLALGPSDETVQSYIGVNEKIEKVETALLEDHRKLNSLYMEKLEFMKELEKRRASEQRG